MTVPRTHNCQPIWVPGTGPVATCTEHYRQQVGTTATTPTTSAGVR